MKNLIQILREFHNTPASLEATQTLLESLTPHISPPLTASPSVLTALTPCIFEIMLQSPSNPHIQHVCLQLLGNLAENSHTAAKFIADAKGIQLLTHTMLLHKESLQISFQGTRALLAIVLSEPAVCPLVIQYFGVEVVVGACKSFLEDINIQSISLQFLTRLAEVDDGDDDDAGTRRSGQARAALRVLKKYKKEYELAGYACRLLNVVTKAADIDTIEQLGRIGTIRLLSLSIIGFRDDEELQTNAYAALCNLVTVDDQCARQLAGMKGAEIVLRAMKRFRGCVPLNVSCVLIVRALADVDDLQALVVYAAGGVETMLSLMIEFCENVEIQRHAIAVLAILAWLREDIRQKISTFGGAQTLCSMLMAHLMNEEIVAPGARLLIYIRQGR